jgi:hypothetical protein
MRIPDFPFQYTQSGNLTNNRNQSVFDVNSLGQVPFETCTKSAKIRFMLRARK